MRELQLATQVEGMVADNELGQLYVGEEGAGIFKFDAKESGSEQATFIANSSEENTAIQYDIEGIAIYKSGTKIGYLIASSQGDNSYAVFSRSGSNEYLGSFTIEDGIVDGTQETDGIDAVSLELGINYPKGLFICQDGFNYDGESKVSQNFKMVSWELIANKLGLH